MSTDPAKQTVADTLRKAREDQGMTQAELRQRLESYGLHLAPTAITKIENGGRGLDVTEASFFAQALNLDWKELFIPAAKIPTQQLRQDIARQLVMLNLQLKKVLDTLQRIEQLGSQLDGTPVVLADDMAGEMDELSTEIINRLLTLEATKGDVQPNG